MPLTTRALTRDDFEESLALITEAFGERPASLPPPSPEDFPRPGYHAFGTFDGDRLVARVATREYHSWFGGSEVPTSGIAGVAVAAERRGERLLDELFRVALEHGRSERGEVISTLFATAPGIYRRFGYELIASYDAVEVPTSALGRVAPSDVATRRASAADFDAVREVYDAWAAAQNGPLTRRGPSFPADAQAFLDSFTGVTLAVDDADRVVGVVSGRRGRGYGDDSTVEVGDLLGLTGDATRALWRVLASFGTVVGRVRISTSGADTARLALPGPHWTVTERSPYLLRIHDVAGAFAARTWPADGALTFTVEGDLVGTTDGTWRLEVTDGRARCEPADPAPDAPVLSPGGLALAWSGAQTCANLRMAGHLRGGSPETDALLDRLLAPRPLHIRDYF